MIIVLNNKCHFKKNEFLSYQEQLATISTSHDLILCPSYPHLALFSLTNFALGSQNVAENNIGAYTGEVSASQLQSYNVKYAIVGHSERRKYQQETKETIIKKIKQLLEVSITPILCIGESQIEKQEIELEEELYFFCKNLKEQEQKKIIVAYEPIWAIGTGNIPTNEQIENAVTKIKKYFPNNKILYGGSVDEKNISEIKSCSHLSGFLIGTISLKVEQLRKLLENLEK